MKGINIQKINMTRNEFAEFTKAIETLDKFYNELSDTIYESNLKDFEDFHNMECDLEEMVNDLSSFQDNLEDYIEFEDQAQA